MTDRDPVPYQVTRTWTVMATDTQDAVDKARPGEHHDSVVRPMPCTDWPLPCTHDPQHVRPAGEDELREILRRLREADDLLTPEHVAQRFGALLDDVTQDKETPLMSRYQVQAEFVSQDQPTAQQLAELCRLLSIHAGDVFGRSAGWRATVFVAMSPSPADAGFDAGEIMRAANETAGMPPARMTDMHVYRIGGVPMPPADGEGQ